MQAGSTHNRWALILAGGSGTRLRQLTREIAGDDRPKQFCPVLGGATLWDETRNRAGLVVPRDRIVSVLTASHERYFRPLLAGFPPSTLVVQPEDRGTAAAILYGLLRIALTGGTDPVVVLPSDHYVSDDAAFMLWVDAVFRAVETRPDLVVLLGLRADHPEVEYGWIEAGPPLAEAGGPTLYRVKRFWEKPAAATARMLLARGCLWNSFVMVGRVPAFLALIRRVAPGLLDALQGLASVLGTDLELAAARAAYRWLPSVNFSREVLTACPANLAVLPVVGVVWADLGTPARVLGTLARTGARPAWLEAVKAGDRGGAEPWRHDTGVRVVGRGASRPG